MDGSKENNSSKKNKEEAVNKAESASIHTMEDVDGKLFTDWREYLEKKPKKRMGTQKADSEASTTTNSSSNSDLESRMVTMGEEEERVTWGGRLLNFQLLHH